jgi:hypothetical protein
VDTAWQRLDSISAIYFNKKSATERRAEYCFPQKEAEIKNKTMDRDGEERGSYEERKADLLSSRLAGYCKEKHFRDKF